MKMPILVGISRKSFIGFVLSKKEPKERLQGTLAATSIAVFNGAHIVRTHDITDETKETILIAEAVRNRRFPDSAAVCKHSEMIRIIDWASISIFF